MDFRLIIVKALCKLIFVWFAAAIFNAGNLIKREFSTKTLSNLIMIVSFFSLHRPNSFSPHIVRSLSRSVFPKLKSCRGNKFVCRIKILRICCYFTKCLLIGLKMFSDFAVTTNNYR